MGDVKRGSDVSILAPGARINGILASSGSLQIYGRVRGELLVEDDVFVSAESVVEGGHPGRDHYARWTSKRKPHRPR